MSVEKRKKAVQALMREARAEGRDGFKTLDPEKLIGELSEAIGTSTADPNLQNLTGQQKRMTVPGRDFNNRLLPLDSSKASKKAVLDALTENPSDEISGVFTKTLKKWLEDADEIANYIETGKLGKMWSKVPLAGPLIAGAAAYATSGGDVQAALDSIAEDFGAPIGEGSDSTGAVMNKNKQVIGAPGLGDPLETLPTLDGNSPMRGPSSENNEAEKRFQKLKSLRSRTDYMEKLKREDPITHERLELLYMRESLADDPQIREAADQYISLKEKFPDKEREEAIYGTVTESEHRRIEQNQRLRKLQFEKADRLLEDTRQQVIKEAIKSGRDNRNVPKYLRDKALDDVQKEGLRKMKEAQEEATKIREELRTPGLHDA